jgi:hypothetical protein
MTSDNENKKKVILIPLLFIAKRNKDFVKRKIETRQNTRMKGIVQFNLLSTKKV